MNATTARSSTPSGARKLLPRARHVGAQRRISFTHALPFLLLSLILCMTTLVGQVNWLILLIFLVCAIWRGLVEHRGWEIPSLPVRMALFVPSAAAVAMIYGVQPTATSLMALLIVLLALKVLELRTARDFTVVALLGYFMVLSALFYTQDFALFLYLLIAVLLNTVSLIRVHSGPRAGRVWPAVRLGAGLMLQAAPLVVLLFVIFPRVQVSFLRRLTNNANGTTGMSDHLQPGGVESLAQSTERVFRAKIESSEAISLSQLYWRGIVLSRCEDPFSWSADLPGVLGPARPPSTEKPLAGSVKQTITLFPQGERWLFALDRPILIPPNSSVRPQFVDGPQVVRSERQLNSTATYDVYSQLRAAPTATLSVPLRKYYTHLPTDISPGVAQMVQSWQAGGAKPATIIHAAQTFFRNGGFIYTLQPGTLPKNNALEYFLFSSKRGFCEHYAAAFTTLMRMAGIPARIVVGYQGGEQNSWGMYYIVRQSDAHAWCEIWLDGENRWVREDPTSLVAPDRLSFGAASYAALAAERSLGSGSGLGFGRLGAFGWARWIGHSVTMAWDSLDQQWNLMVIGYDPDQQFAFMERLGVGDVSWFAGMALALAAVFATLIATAGLMRILQTLPSRTDANSSDDKTRAAYDRFCKRVLAAAGVVRNPGEGPLDFAKRATALRPDLAGEIGRITDLYVQLRYAPGSVGEENGALATLRRTIKEFDPPPLAHK